MRIWEGKLYHLQGLVEVYLGLIYHVEWEGSRVQGCIHLDQGQILDEVAHLGNTDC